MRSIFDLESAAGQGQSPWNKRMQEAPKNADVSSSVASLGARLNQLREADARPEMKRAESGKAPQERNPKMAHETQRAQAAAAASASGGTFSKAGIPDVGVSSSSGASKHASEQRNDYELVLGRGQIASCLFAGTVVVAIFAGGAYFAGKLSAMNCVAASNSIPQASAPLQVPSVLTQQPPASAAAGARSRSSAASVLVPFMLGEAKTGAVQNEITASAAAPASQVANAAALNNAAGATSPNQTAVVKNAPREMPAAQVATAASADAKGSPLFASPQRGALYLQVGAVDRGMATVIAEGLRQHGLTSFVAPGPTDKIFRVLVGPCANQDEYKRVKNEIDSIDVGNFARQFEK